MKPTHTFVAAGLLTGVLALGRIAPAFTHVAPEACPAEQCVAAVVKDWPHFDVGSRGPGYEFVAQGPVYIVAPGLVLTKVGQVAGVLLSWGPRSMPVGGRFRPTQGV